MSYHLAPIANQQQLDANGAPLSGGKIHSYIAGTSTPATTYTDDSGATAQANPIVLNSRGVPASPVWLQGGRTYKFVVTDANDVQLATFDDVAGINDVAGSFDQWVTYANAPTYISATSFSVAGDQTPTFQVGRRLKTVNTGGTVYSSITASVFSAGITTINVRNDSGTLDSGLSTVSYGLISVANTSAPLGPAFAAAPSIGQAIATSTASKLLFQTEEYDSNNAFADSRFTAPVAGFYAFAAGFGVATTATRLVIFLYKNGVNHRQIQRSENNGQCTGAAMLYLAAGDYVEVYVTQGAATQNTDPGGCYFQGALVRPA